MKKNQEINYNSLESLLGIKMSSTLLTMKRLLVKNFEQQKHTISFEEWINLLPLLKEEGLTQKEFAVILGKDKTTVSRLISSWEKKGLVKRKLNPSDKRAVSLIATQKAMQLHSLASPTVIKQDKIFKRGLSNNELNTFIKLLDTIQIEVNKEFSLK
ncbi:MAG: MarR family transcriptional regulator [Leptospiraceae bacterium]|nr:MarR family transcriptional regulator [Leptospiraceae bacterium]